jgi:deoxyribonuclease (pyrimidine dimer)
MTRINVGVLPHELTDRHLLAEHREMKRIPNAVSQGKAVIKDIPEEFRLGKGHVKFFYNKLGYLLRRYKAVHGACISRGFRVQDYSGAWDGVPRELMGDYKPTQRDREIIRERINSRLSKSSK